MGRQLHVIGNWKMNHDVQSCTDFWSELDGEDMPTTVAAGIAAPAPLLSDSLHKCPFSTKIYGQNCHQALSGAYTGETSAALLQSLGCAGVVLGHSERRQYFNESDALIHDKINTATSQNLQAVYCCGESLEQRKAGEHKSFVRSQIENSLFGLEPAQLQQLIIAYEPIWAIGTGETASAAQAEEMCAEIRQIMASKFGQGAADDLIILYGGSVKPSNAHEIFSQENVDGGLVGGASLKAESFVTLLRIAEELMSA